jgi:hypothetical protein
MAVLFLCVAAAAGVLLAFTLRGQAEQVRYLEGEEAAPVFEIDHLNPRLRRFASDTRLLRVALEDPLRLAQSLERGGLGTALTGRRVVVSDQREGLVAELGRSLLVAARDFAEWLASVEQLPPDDQAQLVDRGADWSPLRLRFTAQGYTLDGDVDPRFGAHQVGAALEANTDAGTDADPSPPEGPPATKDLPVAPAELALAAKIGFYVEGLQRIEAALARRADPYR